MPVNKTYHERRAERRCGVCGRQDAGTLAGKALCAECQKAQAESKRRKSLEMVAKGICVECGNPVEEHRRGKRLCEACKEKRAEYARTRPKKPKPPKEGPKEEPAPEPVPEPEPAPTPPPPPKKFERKKKLSYWDMTDLHLCVKCGAKDKRTLSGKALCAKCAGEG